MSPRGGKRPGAGRKPTGRRTRTMSFDANKEEEAAIMGYVKKQRVSISMVIRSAVRWFFDLEQDEGDET